MSGYTMFLGNVQMPVAPGKLQLKIKGKNKTLTLVNDGEINLLKLPGLTDITVDLLLPMLPGYSFAAYPGGFRPPDYYMGMLEGWILERTPVQLIIGRATPGGKLLFDSNITVSVENYDIIEDAANYPDVNVSLALKQYIYFATKTAQIIEPESEAPVVFVEYQRNADSAPQAQSHTVASGDTLWAIARRYYGNGAEYSKIFEANKGTIDNPNRIFPGQVLVIP